MFLQQICTQMTENEGACNEVDTSFSFRLHIVRHAETVANRAGIVLGQIDSPLTNLGVKQALAAHHEYGTHNYWKVFSSDLERCTKTVRLILFGNTENNDTDDERKVDIIHLDKRLRERAKGAREGQCKTLSYSKALELLKKRNGNEGESSGESVPLLETEEEVLERFNKWLEETICAAYAHYCSMKRCGEYNVLAVSHSGTLRTVFENIIGKQLPCNAEREEESGKSGRLVIPNTSKTIIEFTAVSESISAADEVVVSLGGEGSKLTFCRPQLIEYTKTAHFHRVK